MLIQIIYSSAAIEGFTSEGVQELLAQSRIKNARLGITGMLLYIDGSFFQVLEGEEDTVASLFKTISEDERHRNVTTIVHQSIRSRDFADWSMGYADLSADDADAILGSNDFFGSGASLETLTQGRAKKLLQAFKEGRWRSRLSNSRPQTPLEPMETFPTPLTLNRPELKADCKCTFAFQPIINASNMKVFSYEALIRGHHNEGAAEVLFHVQQEELHTFDSTCRMQAIKMAAHLKLNTHLNLNMFPGSIDTIPTTIESILETAAQCGFRPEQLIIEILEHEFIDDPDRFGRIIDRYRSSGLLFAIDDFGSGYAGLNLLADFQPDFIKLDMHLVRDIDRHGARQAIVRGIIRTCFDLGIEIIAEGIETKEEFAWLQHEGITHFQGFLFAAPELEALSVPSELRG